MKSKILIYIFISLFSFCSGKRENASNSNNYENTCNIINDTLRLNYYKPFIKNHSLETIDKLKNFVQVTPKVNYIADSLQHYNFKINKNYLDITIDSCKYKKNLYVSTIFINKKVVIKI